MFVHCNQCPYGEYRPSGDAFFDEHFVNYCTYFNVYPYDQGCIHHTLYEPARLPDWVTPGCPPQPPKQMPPGILDAIRKAIRKKENG